MSPTDEATTEPGLIRVPWSMWGQAGIIVLGAFTSMLSATIVNPALPAIGASTHASSAVAQWVASGYLLALTVGVPVSGWTGRKIGPTRLWLIGLALFCACSILCATSRTIELLIVGRVLQGLAGGLLVPAGQTITSILAGPQRLGRLLSTSGIAIVIAPTLGTTLGSVLLAHATWSWLFWINVPLCAVALLAGARWLPNVKSGIAGPFDGTGLLLVVAGLPLLTYGISAIAQADGFSSVAADAFTGAGVVLLAAYVWWELRIRDPLLQLRLFTNRVFSSGAAVMFLGGAINFATQVILPLYFVQSRHETLVAAGLLLGPQVVGTALGFPLAGRLSDRYGAGLLLVVGGAVTAVATIPLALVGADTGYAFLGIVLFVRGFGVALCTIPAMTVSLAVVRQDQLADATPILNTLQRTGASIGTAVIAVLYGREVINPNIAVQAVHAFRNTAWWLFAGACLLTLTAYVLAQVERTDRRGGFAKHAPAVG